MAKRKKVVRKIKVSPTEQPKQPQSYLLVICEFDDVGLASAKFSADQIVWTPLRDDKPLQLNRMPHRLQGVQLCLADGNTKLLR